MDFTKRAERSILGTMQLLRHLILVSVCVAPGALLCAEEPAKDIFVGLLDEGRVYRRVDGEPILGREVADFFISQDWETELAAFAERVLTYQEMAKREVTVSDQEIDEEIKRMALEFAQRNHVDPELLNPDVLSQKMGIPLATLRDRQRTQLGLKKVLVLEGKLKPEASIEAPEVRALLSERLERTIKETKVIATPEKLPPDVAVQIGERSYPRAAVRAFVLERMGPILRNDLIEALDAITLKRLVSKALAAGQVKELSEDDRLMHLSYLIAMVEMEREIPDGRAVFQAQLKEQGLDMKRYMHLPAFTLDASLTCLARRGLGEEDIKREFEAHPDQYRMSERRMAHLFIRVRDPMGRGYTVKWEVPEHPQVQAFAAAERERRFAVARQEIERLVPLARSDFAAAVQEHSEDEESRRNEVPGLIGRLSERSTPVEPLDADVLKAALKLKPGELSAPVRSAFGWHLLKCLDNQETTYQEARPRVYLNLLKGRREALLKDIRGKAKVEDLF